MCGGLRTVACGVGGRAWGAEGRLARALEAEKGCGAHPGERYVARADASHRLCRRRHRFFAALRMTRGALRMTEGIDSSLRSE